MSILLGKLLKKKFDKKTNIDLGKTKELYQCPNCGFKKVIEFDHNILHGNKRGTSEALEYAKKLQKECVCPKCGIAMVKKGA